MMIGCQLPYETWVQLQSTNNSSLVGYKEGLLYVWQNDTFTLGNSPSFYLWELRPTVSSHAKRLCAVPIGMESSLQGVSIFNSDKTEIALFFKSLNAENDDEVTMNLSIFNLATKTLIASDWKAHFYCDNIGHSTKYGWLLFNRVHRVGETTPSIFRFDPVTKIRHRLFLLELNLISRVGNGAEADSLHLVSADDEAVTYLRNVKISWENTPGRHPPLAPELIVGHYAAIGVIWAKYPINDPATVEALLDGRCFRLKGKLHVVHKKDNTLRVDALVPGAAGVRLEPFYVQEIDIEGRLYWEKNNTILTNNSIYVVSKVFNAVTTVFTSCPPLQQLASVAVQQVFQPPFPRHMYGGTGYTELEIRNMIGYKGGALLHS